MGKDKKVINHPENNLDTRVALLEKAIADNTYALRSFESKFDRIDEKFDRLEAKMDKRFDNIHTELKEIRNNRHEDIKWFVGRLFIMGSFLFGAICGLGGIMAHGFHWF